MAAVSLAVIAVQVRLGSDGQVKGPRDIQVSTLFGLSALFTLILVLAWKPIHFSLHCVFSGTDYFASIVSVSRGTTSKI